MASRVVLMLAAAMMAASPAFGAEDAPRKAAPAEGLPVATDARLGGDETRTRLILDISRPIELTAFTLANPYRVVVDMPQVVFQLPPKAGENGRGLIKAFRYGLVMQGGSRLVIDTTGPVRVDKAFVLDPVDAQPARLVLDLVAIDRATFMRNLAVDARPKKEAPPAPDRDPPEGAGDPRPVVVIDPGHGGLDAGTTAGSGEAEKTIVLDFALRLRQALEKSGKYRVVMTRSDDTFVPLGERVRIARSQKAALFISIHADALPRRDPDTRGATIYTGSETATDAEAARLAESENRADAAAGVDSGAEPDGVVDILADLAQRETKAFSAQFARTMMMELKPAIRLHKQPLRSAGFKVLLAPDVPSVLVELGYVSSPHDLKLMMSEAWRRKATAAMAQAVHAFFAPRLARSAASN